eukprot:6203785-Pleurochrysis_carterae.AAC.1
MSHLPSPSQHEHRAATIHLTSGEKLTISLGPITRSLFRLISSFTFTYGRGPNLPACEARRNGRQRGGQARGRADADRPFCKKLSAYDALTI